MKFEVAVKKDNKYLIKADFGGDVGSRWAETTEAVVTYAKGKFKKGDDCELEYKKDGSKLHVTRITGQGSGGSPSSSSSKSSGGYDKKYSGSNNTADSICRQNANHATSRTLIALQGHVDPNNVFDIASQLHEMFLKLAKGC